MAIENDMLEILLKDKESSCFLWKDEIWQVVNEGTMLMDNHVRENGVFGLYDIIYKDDRELYGKFLSKLSEGSLLVQEEKYIPVEESVVKTSLRILEKNSTFL